MDQKIKEAIDHYNKTFQDAGFVNFWDDEKLDAQIALRREILDIIRPLNLPDYVIVERSLRKLEKVKEKTSHFVESRRSGQRLRIVRP